MSLWSQSSLCLIDQLPSAAFSSAQSIDGAGSYQSCLKPSPRIRTCLKTPHWPALRTDPAGLIVAYDAFFYELRSSGWHCSQGSTWTLCHAKLNKSRAEVFVTCHKLWKIGLNENSVNTNKLYIYLVYCLVGGSLLVQTVCCLLVVETQSTFTFYCSVIISQLYMLVFSFIFIGYLSLLIGQQAVSWGYRWSQLRC